MVITHAIIGLHASDQASEVVRRGTTGDAEARDTDYRESAFDEE